MATFAIVVFVCVFVMALIVFLLDVLGPMHCQSPFWLTIHKLRNILDQFSYWFMNICAIATILVVIYIAIRHFIK